MPIDSPCNTPILPVHKPYGAYCLVQDFCLINEAVIPTHPVVNNPYNLLPYIPTATSHFTVLDLKDTFLTVPDLHFLFAFTWNSPDTWSSRQLT